MDTATTRDPGALIVLGGYTSEMGGSAPGLACYRWDAADSEAVDLVAHPAVALRSPSWVEAHPDHSTVYTVSEGDPGRLHAVRLTADGQLSEGNTVPIDGTAACHLALTADARHLVVANYGDGKVSGFPIAADGSVGEQIGGYGFELSGPDQDRQDHSHAHQVVMDPASSSDDGEVFWVPDLGGDAVHRMRIASDGTIATAGDAVRLPAGSGPRHLVLTGDHMVVACELSAQVWVGRRDGDTYRQVALVDASGRPNGTGDERIYPSGIGLHQSEQHGVQVLVANRGCDSVAVFGLVDDELSMRDEFDTGAWPRDLKVDGDRLWLASQSGNQVITHLLDRETGRWVPDFAFPAPSPACILLVR